MFLVNAIEDVIPLFELAQVEHMTQGRLIGKVWFSQVFVLRQVNLNIRGPSIQKPMKINELLDKTIPMEKQGILLPWSNFIEELFPLFVF